MNEQTIEQSSQHLEAAFSMEDFKTVLKRIAFMAFVAFVAGWLITIIASMMVGYGKIPTMGEVRVNAKGNEYFHAYYPDFRKYAISSAESPHKVEKSKFGEMGPIATGLYIYSISNAFHWMLELKMQNFGIILLFPFFTFIGGGVLLYMKFLPPHLRKKENTVLYTTGIAVIHSLILMVFLLLFYYSSSTFASLYSRDYVYVGQLLGLTLPSAGIILMTNVVFGTLAGAILNGLLSLGMISTND